MDSKLTRKALSLDATTMRMLHELTRCEEREEVGLQLKSIAGATVIACSGGDILVNRVIGLVQAEDDELKEIVAAFRNTGARRAFISVMDDLAGEDVTERLQSSGLREGRSWRKFHLDPEFVPAGVMDVASDLEVREAEVADAAETGRIIGNAFDIPPALHPALGRQIGRRDGNDGWHIFVSHDGERIAGCGGMYVENDSAWLTWGATDPAFRCRGSQRAVMAARLNRARELGLQHLFTETGEEVPDEPQHSWSNIVRAGFQPGGRLRNFIVEDAAYRANPPPSVRV